MQRCVKQRFNSRWLMSCLDLCGKAWQHDSKFRKRSLVFLSFLLFMAIPKTSPMTQCRLIARDCRKPKLQSL